jgi:hypothetical protein
VSSREHRGLLAVLGHGVAMSRPPNPSVNRTNTGGAPLLASLASGAPMFAAYLER